MSYPQPNADEYALGGYKYFRLNTLLSSAGDMYESAQGAHAFSLGPESDISRVNITYFDDQVPNFINQTQIFPLRGFSGRVDARNNTGFYSPSLRPGRVLIWPDEIYDPNFRPSGFSALTDTIIFNTPRLDVIQYFQPQSSLVPQRGDKVFFPSDLPVPGVAGTLWFVIPYYGRRYAMVSVTNFAPVAGTNLNYGLSGLNFAITDNTALRPRHQVTEILPVAAVPGTGGQSLVNITASSDGMFDALLLSFQGLNTVPQLKVVVSDKEG